MTDDLTNKAITWNDISLNDLAQTLKVIVIAYDELISDSCSLLLLLLHDINMYKVAILPELPCQRDTVLTPRRRAEEELTLAILELVELRYGAS